MIHNSDPCYRFYIKVLELYVTSITAHLGYVSIFVLSTLGININKCLPIVVKEYIKDNLSIIAEDLTDTVYLKLAKYEEWFDHDTRSIMIFFFT